MSDRYTAYADQAERFLPAALLARVRARAEVCDRENRFCDEDIAELRETGYLTALVPVEFGGPGLTLEAVTRLQQRLAAAAPATALAVNMHLMCLGVARALLARGDESLNGVFAEALAGEVFAFGISEAGNDWVLQDSRTVAEPQADGGYALTGTKIFTSLSPIWTRLLVHAKDTSEPDEPRLVYGFLAREDGGFTVSEHWDVLGMRASQSRNTRLDRAPLRAQRVVRVLQPGRVPDALTFAITSNFQLLVASVYAGIAARGVELAADGLRSRRSAKAGEGLDQVPEHRITVADLFRDQFAIPAQIESCARDFDERVDHGAAWPLRLVAARLAAAQAARRATEVALQCTGGAGFDNGHEASRLYRDAAAGMFHPPSADAARQMYAAALFDV